MPSRSPCGLRVPGVLEVPLEDAGWGVAYLKCEGALGEGEEASKTHSA